MICDCNGILANTGNLGDAPKFGLPYGMYIVPLNANDGTRNSLDITDPATLGTQLLAMVNNVDPSKRAYPIMDLRNFVIETANSEFETADNGTRNKLRDGIVTTKAEIWDASNEYFNKIKDNCTSFGTYLVDLCGNVQGQLEGDEFYPRPSNNRSFDAMFAYRTNAGVSKIMIEFDYDITATNEIQSFITSDEFGAIKPDQMWGLLNGNFDVTVLTDTTLKVVATYDFGSVTNRMPLRGQNGSFFTLRNETTNATVVIDSAVENVNTPGEYLVTLDVAQTTGNLGTITGFKASTGIKQNGIEGRKSATFTYL